MNSNITWDVYNIQQDCFDVKYTLDDRNRLTKADWVAGAERSTTPEAPG